MTDTPRTDAVLASYFNPGPSRLGDLARELEGELNAANAIIRQQKMDFKVSDDLREWLKRIPIVTDADKAELRDAITKLEAQQRGTRNAETMLCEMLEVDDGSQILDAIQGLKDRIKRLEEASDEWMEAKAKLDHLDEVIQRWVNRSARRYQEFLASDSGLSFGEWLVTRGRKAER